jgi:hypothetical protein
VQEAALSPPISALAYPRGQKLSQKAEPFTAVHEPGGHNRQFDRPATGVYRPGGQGQGSPIPAVGQNEPAGHAVGDDEPATQNEPTGQGVEQFDVAPTRALHVPTAQSVHGEEPVELQDPAEHEPALH